MRSFLILGLWSFLVLFGTVASAQDEAPATGWMVQARMPATTLSSLVSSTLGSPQFLIGWRGDRFGLGAGLGINRFNFTTETSRGGFSSEDKTTATIFQIAPAAWFDFTHSPSGSTVGNVLVSVGYGRVNAKTENSFSSPSGSGSSESSFPNSTIISRVSATLRSIWTCPSRVPRSACGSRDPCASLRQERHLRQS